MRRLRTAPKAPAAVAGILAMPLFFVGLMAMSLAVEKPSVGHALKHGKTVTVLGDPTGTTEAKIWLLAAVPPLALALLGVASMLLGRAGVVVAALGAIALCHRAARAARRLGERPRGSLSGRCRPHFPRASRSRTSTCAASGRPTRNARPSSSGSRRCRSRASRSSSFGLLEFRRRRGLVRPLPPPPPADRDERRAAGKQ